MTAVPKLTPQAEAALRYAEIGWSVFPCWWPQLDRCACGNDECSSPAKHPIGPAVSAGWKDATTDHNTIISWWTRWPQANVAISLTQSGLFVTDIDGPAGATRWQELSDTYGTPPATLTAQTGRAEGDGRHLFYQQPDPPLRSCKLGHPKLEIRGDGAYVIAAPSIHISGAAYLWEEGTYEVADPPAWLIGEATIVRPKDPDVPGNDLIATPDTSRRITALAGAVATAQEGNRNHLLNWAAHRAGRLVGAGIIDEHQAREQLTQAALRAGLTRQETDATITSGLTAGTQNPEPAPIQPITIQPAEQPNEPAQEHDRTSSWTPVAADPYIDGTWEPPQPTHLQRTDGTHLFYPNRINLLFGESETGKGWVALHAIAQALAHQHPVLYIDFEDYADTIYRRLKLLGTTPDQLRTYFAYIRPDHGLDEPGRQALGEAVIRLQPDLVIIDGVTGAMSMHQLDTNSSTDVDQFYSLIGEPLARIGAAVVFIDHVTKSSENRGKGPIGSQHKRARVSGASYEVVSIQQIAPGRAGKLRIKIDKDRLGAVRATHPAIAGTFHLDSTSTDRTVAQLHPPSASQDPFRPTHAMQAVSQALADAGPNGLSRRGIEDLGGYSKDTLVKAAEALVDEGYAARESGPNRSLIHRHVKPFTAGPTVLMSPGVPGTSPGVPNGPGTPLRPPAETDVPGVPRLTKRGTGDTGESDPPDTTGQVPM